MSKTGLIGVVVAAVVLIAAGIWFMNKPAAAPADMGTATGEAMTNTTNSNNTTSSGDQTAPAPAGDSGSGATSVSVDVHVDAAPKTTTVTYDGATFAPKTVTIAKGDTVSFVDASGRGFWVASDAHPSHTGFDDTSRSAHCVSGYAGPTPFDECVTGTKFTFTFTMTGSFGYHDHMNGGAGGTVVVK